MGDWTNLVRHPDYPMPDVNGVEVCCNRLSSDLLSMRFVVSGDLSWIELPEPKHPSDYARRDELWRTTCFEWFLRPDAAGGYFEGNLAPSGDWAAYQFDSYRTGMRDAKAMCSAFGADPGRTDWYDISALFRLPLLAGDKRWSVGLSAIIEAQDGTKSYWALAHAPGPPDFHNPACFTARLPAPPAV